MIPTRRMQIRSKEREHLILDKQKQKLKTKPLLQSWVILVPLRNGLRLYVAQSL